MVEELSWRDAERRRVVVVREGLAGGAVAALVAEGWGEFELLSTERALTAERALAAERGRGAERGSAAERGPDAVPGLAEVAGAVHLVPPGQVPDTAAAVIEAVGAERLVALGGGRVIDTAKAIAAVRGGEVAAIPTTLSGAEMTAIHRLPAGRAAAAGVRPALVLADPLLMTSAPEPELRASAINALAHGADSLCTPLADRRSRELALEGAALLGRSLDAGREGRDRAELALGALRCAEALDLAGLALHHVLSQTAVRVLGTPHAQTNAALLPVTMEEMAGRAPERIAALAGAIGSGAPAAPAGATGGAAGAGAAAPAEGGGGTAGAPGGPGLGAKVRARIEELAGGRWGLGELGADADRIAEVVAAALTRPDLAQMTPGEVTAADLRRLLERAW